MKPLHKWLEHGAWELWQAAYLLHGRADLSRREFDNDTAPQEVRETYARIVSDVAAQVLPLCPLPVKPAAMAEQMVKVVDAMRWASSRGIDMAEEVSNHLQLYDMAHLLDHLPIREIQPQEWAEWFALDGWCVYQAACLLAGGMPPQYSSRFQEDPTKVPEPDGSLSHRAAQTYQYIKTACTVARITAWSTDNAEFIRHLVVPEIVVTWALTKPWGANIPPQLIKHYAPSNAIEDDEIEGSSDPAPALTPELPAMLAWRLAAYFVFPGSRLTLTQIDANRKKWESACEDAPRRPRAGATFPLSKARKPVPPGTPGLFRPEIVAEWISENYPLETPSAAEGLRRFIDALDDPAPFVSIYDAWGKRLAP